jgi:hypothetical protein
MLRAVVPEIAVIKAAEYDSLRPEEPGAPNLP